MKKTTNGNSCLISESRHFPNNKKKLRNQRNGNKRQNNKMATNEKTERKKTTRIYGGFWSSSAVKRAISSYYILLLLLLSPRLYTKATWKCLPLPPTRDAHLLIPPPLHRASTQLTHRISANVYNNLFIRHDISPSFYCLFVNKRDYDKWTLYIMDCFAEFMNWNVSCNCHLTTKSKRLPNISPIRFRR